MGFSGIESSFDEFMRRGLTIGTQSGRISPTPSRRCMHRPMKPTQLTNLHLSASVDFTDASKRISPSPQGVIDRSAQSEIACALRTRPPERAGTSEEIGAGVSLTKQSDRYHSAFRIRSILYWVCLSAQEVSLLQSQSTLRLGERATSERVLFASDFDEFSGLCLREGNFGLRFHRNDVIGTFARTYGVKGTFFAPAKSDLRTLNSRIRELML